MWVANQTCLPQIATLQIATAGGVSGTPAFMPSVNNALGGTLMGVPIEFNEHAEVLGDTNDIMLADWSQYLEGSKGGINSAESVHVRFVYNEKAFKFGMRNDGKSWWKEKLTPKKGLTMSPFIGLNTK
jgi:HK97 family phage major capsid protein